MNIYPFINRFIEHSYYIFHAIAQKQWEISTNCLFCKLDFYREASLERTSIIYGYDGTALFYKRMCRYISMGVCAPEYSSFIQALQNSFLYNKASVDVISRIWLAGRGTWPRLYVTTEYHKHCNYIKYWNTLLCAYCFYCFVKLTCKCQNLHNKVLYVYT